MEAGRSKDQVFKVKLDCCLDPSTTLPPCSTSVTDCGDVCANTSAETNKNDACTRTNIYSFVDDIAKISEEGLLHATSPLPPPLEIDRRRVNLLDEIGSGNYGKVTKGSLAPEASGGNVMTVAVKSVKADAPAEETSSLLREATLMSQVITHLPEPTFGLSIYACFPLKFLL